MTDLLGPAEDIIIDDAFETIEVDEKTLSLQKIPELITTISDHLEPADKLTFKKWALNQLKKID